MIKRLGNSKWITDRPSSGPEKEAKDVVVEVTMFGIKIDTEYIPWEEIDKSRKLISPLVS